MEYDAIWENEPQRYFYGFPDVGDGVKIGVHHQGEMTDPDRLNRTVSEGEMARAEQLLRDRIPRAAGKPQSAVVCMYTNTPDEHFILDTHPMHPQIVIQPLLGAWIQVFAGDWGDGGDDDAWRAADV